MSRPPPAPVPVVPAAPVTSVRASLSPRRFALYILFASMTMLFGAVLVGFVFTRLQNPVWRTPEMAALPTGLWLSTAVLIGVSISFQAALAAARKNRSETLNRRLLLGTVLVAGFLGAQVQNWAIIHRGELLSPIRTLYPSTFYMLTGIHHKKLRGMSNAAALVRHLAGVTKGAAMCPACLAATAALAAKALAAGGFAAVAVK